MSNLHFNRTEMHKNHEELRRFYDEILRDFMERLHTEFRYKPKGNLTEQSIDKLERVTLSACRSPKKYFATRNAFSSAASSARSISAAMRTSSQRPKTSQVRSRTKCTSKLRRRKTQRSCPKIPRRRSSKLTQMRICCTLALRTIQRTKKCLL